MVKKCPLLKISSEKDRNWTANGLTPKITVYPSVNFPGPNGYHGLLIYGFLSNDTEGRPYSKRILQLRTKIITSIMVTNGKGESYPIIEIINRKGENLMLYATPGMRQFPLFEHPFIKTKKEFMSDGSVKNDSAVAKNLFNQTFISKINTEFQNTPVTIEFETIEKSIKKVIGAVITETGHDFIELNPVNPLVSIVVLTFIPGMPIPLTEFSSNLVIRNIDRIISIGKA